MASNFRLEIHNEGFREVRLAQQARLNAMGEAIAAAAGPGMVVIPDPTSSRARTIVLTATPEARKAEATERALTRALDAGRNG